MLTLHNNLKITWRNFLKDKLYAWIKIGGFAIGIAACFLIALFIQHEVSYDKHYKNTERIFRVINAYNNNGDLERWTYQPAPFCQALMDEFPEIEKAGHFNSSELFGAGSNQMRLSDGTENYYEEGFVYFNQELLDILEVSFIHGNPENALNQAGSVVITKNKADKYFPNENPVGQSLVINNNAENSLEITGVIEDFPENSHVQYDFLIGLHPNIFYSGEQTRWNANNYHAYILVKPGTDVHKLENKLESIKTKYLVPVFREQGDARIDELINHFKYTLQPISDVHLQSEGIQDGHSHGDIRFVWIFGAIALFILVIAGINFINLSTAKSANRAKEVGLRKTIGARKKLIIGQFLHESTAYSIMSIIFGILLTAVLLPFFNNLSGKSLSLPWTEWWFYPAILVFALFIGILAGLYPALHLSSFKPVNALKGKMHRGFKSANLRNGLVVFQFTTSVILIIGAIVIYQQMDFILNKKLGFKKDQVIILHGTTTLEEKIASFKQELKKLPDVQNATISNYLPIQGTRRNQNTFWNEGKTRVERGVGAQIWDVDYDYINTLGMNLVQGRNFSESFSTDDQAIIINETMAKELNLTEPLSKRITNGGRTFEVIGVVEDFHFENMKTDIRPLCLELDNSPHTIAAKVNTTDMSSLIGSIQSLWKEFSPNQTFRYTFLDSDYARMYKDVERMGHIFLSFALLAIIVAALGLFGLAEFITKERTKEIGVRKVNGARMREILSLLNKDFLTWVIIAIVLACPIAWYSMKKWLENFAYRTDMSWWIFAFSGITAIIIAILTVSWQSWRAARRNPVEALRYE